MNSRSYLTFKSTFQLRNQRNWLNQVWLLKFWSVINCIFLHWTKKLTLANQSISTQKVTTNKERIFDVIHDSGTKKFGSIRFLWEHVGGLFFVTKKKCGRRETCVGDKDIFLEKRIPLTLLSWFLATDYRSPERK